MWLFTRYGFYSIVRRPDGYHVRGRVRSDLENLKVAAGLKAPVRATPDGDYRYRLILKPGDWARVMVMLAQSVDYPDFKGRIVESPDQCDRHDLYSEVWAMMGAGLRDED